MAGAVVATVGETLVDPIATLLNLTFPPLASFFPKSELARSIDASLSNFFAETFAFGNALWNIAFQPIVDAVTKGIAGVFPSLDSIRDAVIQAFATVSIDTTKVTNAIIAVIQTQLATALNQAFATIADVASNITAAVNDYTNFWGTDLEQKLLSVKDSLSTLSSIAQAQLANIFNVAVGTLGNLNNVIRPKLDAILTALGGDIVGALKGVYDQVVSIGISLNQVITDSLATLTPQIIAGFGTFLTGASDQLNSLITQSFSSVSNLVSSTLTQLGEIEYYISTEFKYWVGEAAEYIISSLRGQQQNFGVITDVVLQGVNTLENDIAALAAQDQAYYTSLGTQISDGWISFNQSIQTTLGGIWAGFQTDVLGPAAAAMGGFFGGISDKIRGFFAPLACDVGAIADWFGGIFQQISTWIQSLCGKDCQRDISQGLPDPFNLISRSLTGVIGVGGGLGLSLMAGELISPLKQLGMSRLAAYFWDLADFKTVGGSVLGALNNASTLKPLIYGLNEFFRPTLPSEDQEKRWFYWDRSRLADLELGLRRHGYADAYIEQITKTIWEVPSQRIVLNMIETPGIDTEWIRDVLRRHGYSEADVEILVSYAHRKRLMDEFAELKSAYETAYITGYVDRDTYKLQLQSIGRSDSEILWAIYAADRKEETARLKEDIDIIVAAFRADNLTLQAFEDEIYKLPLTPAKAQNLIEKEIARKRTTAAARKATKQARLSVAEVLKGYDYQIFTDVVALARLVQLNYTPEDAVLILTIHKGQIAAREADAAQKAQADAEALAIKTEIALANEWAKFLVAAITFREISADDAKTLISELPLSDARKELYYKEADLNASRPAKTGTAAKPKQLREADVYKALFSNLITYDDALAYLIQKGYTEQDAMTLLAINAPTYGPTPV